MILKPSRPVPILPSLVLAAALVAGGCASSKPDLDPLAGEVSRLLEETRNLAADETSTALLAGAEASYQEYQAARDGSRWDQASMSLQEARAAGRAALAAAQAERWRNEADGCRRTAAEVRREWQDAVAMLEKSEKVAGRQARGVTRELADTPSPGGFPELMAPPSAVMPEPAVIQDASQEWKLAADRYTVATSDVDGVVINALTVAETPKVDPAVRDHHLRLGAWAVLELGYRVLGEASRRSCSRALREALEMAGYRDQALWAMVDLERSMKDSARLELEEERQRLADRENQLYESLKQFEGQFASIRKEARGTIMSLSDILFDFGKSELRREAELNLAKVAVILLQYPEMNILVEGHTDNVGSEKFNLDLSEKRAKAVYDFLISQGVEEARMETRGYGFSQPVAPNDTPEGRQQNRRVDLVIREE